MGACVSSLFLWHNGLCKIIPKGHGNTSELGDCEAVPVHSAAATAAVAPGYGSGLEKPAKKPGFIGK